LSPILVFVVVAFAGAVAGAAVPQGKLAASELQLWQAQNAQLISQDVDSSAEITHLPEMCSVAKSEPVVKPPFLRTLAGTVAAIQKGQIKGWNDLKNQVVAAKGRASAYTAAARSQFLRELSAMELAIAVDIASDTHLIAAANEMKKGTCNASYDLKIAANESLQGNDAFHRALDALTKLAATPS
jgi:hypothetical protein